jgi:hypothetical protein
MDNLPLDFEQYVQEYFPQYDIDKDNIDVIKKVSLWAKRDKEFEKDGEYYLHKGLFICGPVGTGKTDLFHMLRMYLGRYLNSSYKFRREVVWEFTATFCKRGYEAISNQDIGNCYYDELCLIDARSNFPNKEQATHYGNKLLVGEEIIMKRYDAFKSMGLQSHFTTNASPAQLREVYGERAFSRLTEMCNFLFLVGDDRRGGKPNIYKDTNNPAEKAVWSSGKVEADILEIKNGIEDMYQKYLKTNELEHESPALLYSTLVGFGVKVIDEEAMNLLQEELFGGVLPRQNVQQLHVRVREKMEKVYEQAKIIAVNRFFLAMKEKGAQSLFTS